MDPRNQACRFIYPEKHGQARKSNHVCIHEYMYIYTYTHESVNPPPPLIPHPLLGTSARGGGFLRGVEAPHYHYAILARSCLGYGRRGRVEGDGLLATTHYFLSWHSTWMAPGIPNVWLKISWDSGMVRAAMGPLPPSGAGEKGWKIKIGGGKGKDRSI